MGINQKINKLKEIISFQKFKRWYKKDDKTVVKSIIDQSLEKIDCNYNVKLEAQFEKDYPGRKAIWKGNPTGLFKQWLHEKNLSETYFKEEDLGRNTENI